MKSLSIIIIIFLLSSCNKECRELPTGLILLKFNDGMYGVGNRGQNDILLTGDDRTWTRGWFDLTAQPFQLDHGKFKDSCNAKSAYFAWVKFNESYKLQK